VWLALCYQQIFHQLRCLVKRVNNEGRLKNTKHHSSNLSVLAIEGGKKENHKFTGVRTDYKNFAGRCFKISHNSLHDTSRDENG
jgi:hypothetical protein